MGKVLSQRHQCDEGEVNFVTRVMKILGYNASYRAVTAALSRSFFLQELGISLMICKEPMGAGRQRGFFD